MKCEICGYDKCDNLKGLSFHLTKKHPTISKQEYYDRYVDGEHFCRFCGEKARFDSLNSGYKDTCGSYKCGKEKERETRLRLYGKYESDDSIKRGLSKLRTVMLEKYGVDNSMRSGSIFRESIDKNAVSKKLSESNKKAWANYTADERKKRIDKTADGVRAIPSERKAEIYATIHSKRDEKTIHEKIRATCLERYGVDNPLKDPKIRSKIFSSRKERNGGFLSSSEKMFDEMLTNRSIEHEYDFVYNQKHWDFRVGDILVEIDGEYNHAILSDPDGKLVKDGLDDYRFQLASPYRLLVIDSRKISDGISELIRLIGKDYKTWIDEIINSCTDFPYYNYSMKRMALDFSHLCSYKWAPGHKLCYSIIDNYHRSIFDSRVGSKPSPKEAWENKDILRRCVENRFIYSSSLSSKSVLRGFSVCKIAPKVSVFNPSLARHIIETYLSEFDTIFDPFSGFSGRMIGAASLGKRYIGNDIAEAAVLESNSIIRDFDFDAEVSVKDVFENSGKYDCLFTCSPYGNKESWTGNERNLTCDEWIDVCLSRFECSKYLFVVDETEKYKDNVVETIRNKSHFSENFEKVILIER